MQLSENILSHDNDTKVTKNMTEIYHNYDIKVIMTLMLNSNLV